MSLEKKENLNGSMEITEDDTFRALNRIPFDEMRYIYLSNAEIPSISLSGKEHPVIVAAFAAYGWTVDEFITDRRMKGIVM